MSRFQNQTVNMNVRLRPKMLTYSSLLTQASQFEAQNVHKPPFLAQLTSRLRGQRSAQMVKSLAAPETRSMCGKVWELLLTDLLTVDMTEASPNTVSDGVLHASRYWSWRRETYQWSWRRETYQRDILVLVKQSCVVFSVNMEFVHFALVSPNPWETWSSLTAHYSKWPWNPCGNVLVWELNLYNRG